VSDSRPPAADTPAALATELLGWCAFSCAVVPVVLLLSGVSPGGALIVAAGLVLLTTVCRVLLRASTPPERPRRHRKSS
jgi:protein-S-isoprenylcysteine O-methyltransferase Ste14